MDWYLSEYGPFIGVCLGIDLTYFIRLADQTASVAPWRDSPMSLVMTIALSNNKCLR